MTADRDLDRPLGSWLDQRATASAPDGLLERSLARVDATLQRPGWLVRDRGRSPRTIGRPSTAQGRVGRLLVITVAVVVLAIGSGMFLRQLPATIAGPSGAPSIVPAPSASQAPSETPSVVQPKPGMFAFIRASGYAGQLWVSNKDGTGARQLAPDLAGSKGTPSWSPDGTRLVFSLTPMGNGGMDAFYPLPDGEGSRLYLTDASGSAPQLVDTGCVAPCSGDSDASFSSDGTRLVFVRRIVRPQLGSPDPVTGKGPGATISRVLATIDLSTGRVEELASTTILDCPLLPGQRQPGVPNCGGFQNHRPRWSPDGTQIVFTQDVPYDINGPTINGFMAPSPPPVLFVVDADGRNLHKVSTSGSFGDWSPDGTRIVFQSESNSVPVLRAGSGQGYLMSQYFDIYTIRPDGTDLRRLTSDQISSAPSWSADGRIGFVRQPTVGGPGGGFGPPQLWVMDADGSNAAPLSVSPLLWPHGGIQNAWPIAWPPQP